MTKVIPVLVTNLLPPRSVKVKTNGLDVGVAAKKLSVESTFNHTTPLDPRLLEEVGDLNPYNQ
jgi:hypothetical protein